LEIKCLSELFTRALSLNVIPHIWMLAKIIPIANPNKDISQGTSYRPISLLSHIAKIGESSATVYNTTHTSSQTSRHEYPKVGYTFTPVIQFIHFRFTTASCRSFAHNLCRRRRHESICISHKLQNSRKTITTLCPRHIQLDTKQ